MSHAPSRIRRMTRGIPISQLAALGAGSLAWAGVLGAFSVDVPPSARALAAATCVYALAPLFAPAPALASAVRSAPALAWCAAAAVLAAACAALTGAPPGALPAIGATIFLMTAVSQLAAAALPARFAEADARRGLLCLVQLLGLAMPLWLAPLAELRGSRSELGAWIVTLSPLSHLASAAGCDYLRTEWFYRNSALGSLRFEYPATPAVLGAYAAAAAALVAGPALATRFIRSISTEEQTRWQPD